MYKRCFTWLFHKIFALYWERVSVRFISWLSLRYCGKCGPCANRSLFLFVRKFRGCIL